MPRIEIIDWYGSCWSITSSDPETIGRWLVEHVRKFVSVNSAMGDIRMRVWPMPSGTVDAQGKDEYDWPIGGTGQFYNLTREKLTGLAEYLEGNASLVYIDTPVVHSTYNNPEKEDEMSVARWCDYGDHSYKGGRKGTVMMGMTGDNEEQDVREMCPECAAALGLNNDYKAPEPPAERKAAITRGTKAQR